MNSKFASKALGGSVLILSTLCLSSCSSLWLQGDQSVDSYLSDAKTQTVSKQQYDELSKKYQALLDQSRVGGAPIAASSTDKISLENEQIKPQFDAVTALDPSDLVSQIDTNIPDLEHKKISPMNRPQENTAPVAGSFNVKHLNQTEDLDEQISKLREVQTLALNNKFDQALAVLKDLEDSKEKQIAVRAKMLLADLLFGQQEYDLASQVYEEVISQYAFSGFVVKALGKLVVCSEKLKQPEKQAKYYSLLHDFFEAT